METIEVEQEKIDHLKSILRTFKKMLDNRLSKSNNLGKFGSVVLEGHREGVEDWLNILEEDN